MTPRWWPWIAGGWVACGLVAGAWAQQAIGVSSQRDWLLQQVRLGEATGRLDLADSALKRLQLLAPDDAQVLLASLEIELSQQKMDVAAATYKRLQTVAAGQAELARATRLWNVYHGSDVATLEQARLLAMGGQGAKALAIYRELFHDDPPGLQLGVEYWRLRGGEPAGRALAISRLQALDTRYPDNAPLLQALAQLQFSAGRDGEALATLKHLGVLPGAGTLAAGTEWAFLSTQDATESNVRRLRSFIARHAGVAVAADARKLYAEQSRKVADPAWRAGLAAQAALDAGRNADAQQGFARALRGYPNEADFLGGMGQALMHQGRRDEAIAYFRRAQRALPAGSNNSKWHDLAVSTSYWLGLQQADAALAAGHVDAAAALYAKAHQQQPREVNAVLGLADIANARGDTAGAQRLLQQARGLAPGNAEVVRRLAVLHGRAGLASLKAFVASLPTAQRAAYADELARLQQDSWRAQREQARQRGDLAQAIALGRRMRGQQPADPWLAYGLAGDLRQRGEAAAADQVMRDMLAHAGSDPAAHYAMALYLSGSARDTQAVATLHQLPAHAWTADMHALAARLAREQRLREARALHAQGRDAQAAALLAVAPNDADAQTLLADWARERGDYAAASRHYQRALAARPGDVDAELGAVQALIGAGHRREAGARMRGPLAQLKPTSAGQQRQLAAIWQALGDADRARAVLRTLLADEHQADAQGWRDLARLERRHAPADALDAYARAMADAGLLAPAQAAPRDDLALTRASREQAGDDWLARSLRSDVDAYYRAQNPTLTVAQDTDQRSDGTPGVSRLARATRIAQLEWPLAGGGAWLRLEQATLDAGRFATDGSGRYVDDFGSCNLPLQLAGGSAAQAPGCASGVQQRLVTGAGLAAGWHSDGDHWEFDLGHTPSGYRVGHWLAGVTYNGDLGPLYFGLTLSRRPLDNSLLSEAGAVDPRGGLVWGGVVATGPTFSLGYDQGGRNGVWSSWAWQTLTGRNVASNRRLRVMGGWYYKLVLTPTLRVNVGASAMLWRYQRDLGDYTLGQGGYYSPQRYASFSIPASVAWRDGDWSLLAEASYSVSRASSTAIGRYPLPAAIDRVLAGLGGTYAGASLADNGATGGGSSSGTGYRLHLAAERRLGNHLVLGVSGTVQRSQDFSPNTFQLYLRYVFHPWQGNLPLPVAPLETYAERR